MLAYIATRKVKHIGVYVRRPGHRYFGDWRAICGSHVTPIYHGISARLLFSSVPEHTADPRWTRPCLVGQATGREQTVLTMLAAAMHKGLEPMEQAEAFTRLLDFGLSRSEIAKQTGYSMATIENRLLLAHLPPDAGQMVADKQLSLGSATALARQVRDTRAGSVAKRQIRSAWFTPAHPLHASAAAICGTEHAKTRARIGGVCGQCWEQAIRDHQETS